MASTFKVDLFAILLSLSVSAHAMAQCQLHKLVADAPSEGAEFGGRVAISGDTVAVGMIPSACCASQFTNVMHFYGRNIGGTDNWGLASVLPSSDGVPEDSFGPVDVDGDWAVVGAPRHDHGCAGNCNEGAAYVFRRDVATGSWSECAELLASDALEHDLFGADVAISGNTILIGASVADTGSAAPGKAYVFVRTKDCVWSQAAILTTTDGAIFDSFGYSVALDGDVAAVGAISAGSGGLSRTGAAYIFERPTGGWTDATETRKLVIADPAQDKDLGADVSLEGDTAVVGAPGDDTTGVNSGAMYVFERDQGGQENWGQVAKLWAPSSADLGSRLYLSQGRIVTGVRFRDGGSVHLFDAGPNGWDDGTTDHVYEFTGCDTEAGDRFGVVALDGSTCVVGANADNDACPGNPECNSGAAYVFSLDETCSCPAVPALSGWGLVVMTLLVLSAGTLVCVRRHSIPA